MFQKLSDWIFNRALRLPATVVKVVAKLTGQDTARIVALNDAVAGLAAAHAVDAAEKLVDSAAKGHENAGN